MTKDSNISFEVKESVGECDLFYIVEAFKNKEKVGEYGFKLTLPCDEPRMLPENTLIALDAETYEGFRRQGIATKAYCFIEEHTGFTLVSDKKLMTQTADGKLFWAQKNRPFGNS